MHRFLTLLRSHLLFHTSAHYSNLSFHIPTWTVCSRQQQLGLITYMVEFSSCVTSSNKPEIGWVDIDWISECSIPFFDHLYTIHDWLTYDCADIPVSLVGCGFTLASVFPFHYGAVYNTPIVTLGPLGNRSWGSLVGWPRAIFKGVFVLERLGSAPTPHLITRGG